MDPVETAATPQIRCDTCGEYVPGYDSISYGSVEKGYRELCSQCFNTELARLDGLQKFEHVKFQPVLLTDCAGETHEFHFRTRLFGAGVSVEAFELHDGYPAGYQFQIIGEPEGDLLALLGRLIEKMRRGLSIKHLQEGELGLQIADHQVLRGLLEWDSAEDGRLPCVIVDGRAIAWHELGRMLMTFEGCQFKLEIRDRSEEL